MTNNFFKIKNFVIYFFYFLFFSSAYSETIKKINIKGNKRISNETVIMFSGLNLAT